MAQADIATLIETHRDEIVGHWVAAVRADSSIQSDADLSEGGLIDHVPFLLDEMCQLLRAGEQPNPQNMFEARVHAYTRFRQGYRARDLVREIALLRHTLLQHLHAKLSTEADRVLLKDVFDAVRSLDLYLDEELRFGVAIYTEGNGAQPAPASA
jgi:RsbT co-antagonist protein rsbRD N-terminal domain